MAKLRERIRRRLRPDEERRRSLRTAAMLTAAAGAAYAVLFLLSFYLARDAPGASASDAEIVNYYSGGGNRTLILVGLYLMPFAGIALIWFIVALRMWASASIRRENVLLSNVQLVSGVVFVALFFVASAASTVVAAGVQFGDADIDPDFARQFPQFSDTVLFVFAFRMAAMFVFTTSSMGRSAGILPRWFTLAGYAVGLFLLLSASFEPWFVLVFPAWLLVLSGLLVNRARRIPADVELPSHVHPIEGLRRA
jgi:hypothetical protein